MYPSEYDTLESVLLHCKLQITSNDHIIIDKLMKCKEMTRTSSHRRSSRRQCMYSLNAALLKLVIHHISNSYHYYFVLK